MHYTRRHQFYFTSEMKWKEKVGSEGEKLIDEKKIGVRVEEKKREGERQREKGREL